MSTVFKKLTGNGYHIQVIGIKNTANIIENYANCKCAFILTELNLFLQLVNKIYILYLILKNNGPIISLQLDTREFSMA